MLAVYLNDAVLDWRIALVLVANILAVSSAFIINDVVDAEDDALDPDKREKNIISSTTTISQQTGVMAFWLVALSALALYLISGWWAIFWGVVGISLAYMYSMNPFRLKARPLVDIVSHVVGAGSLPLIIGYFLYDNSPGVAWYVILAMTFISAYGQFYNQLDDFEIDAAAGLKTTTIVIGKSRARLLMYAFVTLSVLCMALAILMNAFPPWVGTVVIVCALACSLFAWKTDMRGNPAGVDAVQVPTLLTLNLVSMLWVASAIGLLTIGG